MTLRKKKIKSGMKREQDERRKNKNTDLKEKVDHLQEMWVLGSNKFLQLFRI